MITNEYRILSRETEKLLYCVVEHKSKFAFQCTLFLVPYWHNTEPIYSYRMKFRKVFNHFCFKKTQLLFNFVYFPVVKDHNRLKKTIPKLNEDVVPFFNKKTLFLMKWKAFGAVVLDSIEIGCNLSHRKLSDHFLDGKILIWT